MDTFFKSELPMQTKLLILFTFLFGIHYFSLLSNPFFILIGIIFINQFYAASIITIILLFIIFFLILVIQKNRKAYYAIYFYLFLFILINTLINLISYLFLKQDTTGYIKDYFLALLPQQYSASIIPMYILTEVYVLFLTIIIMILIQSLYHSSNNKWKL